VQNLVNIGGSAAELLHILYFQNGVRPPSWIWYDVMSDHPQFAFDGPNIRLKLHVDRCYTVQDIAIFIFGPFCLFMTLWEGVLGYYPLNVFRCCRKPKRTVLVRKHVVWAINRENLSTVRPGCVPVSRPTVYNQLTRKKAQNRNNSSIRGEAPLNGLKWKFAHSVGLDIGDVIMDVMFKFEKFQDFDVMELKNALSHWLCTWALPQCSATAMHVIALKVMQTE